MICGLNHNPTALVCVSEQECKHQFESGLGASYYYSKFRQSYWGLDSNAGGSVFASLLVGYRYQPLKRGITARAGASLLYGSFLPIFSPHLSVGYRF